MKEIKNIYIEGTAKTPQIDFNQLSGELIIHGKSIPENAIKIYEPLLNWVNEYVQSPHHTTNLRLNLEYFNTSSFLWFIKIIKALSKITRENHVLFIHQYFDIEDFEDMDQDEIRDIVGQLVDNIGDSSTNVGVKIYGTDKDGRIVKESMVFI
jgi:hypothetical protein